MALSSKDLEAIKLLFREEFDTKLSPLRTVIREEIDAKLTPVHEDLRERFDDVASNFDALFVRDEKREEEYLVVRG